MTQRARSDCSIAFSGSSLSGEEKYEAMGTGWSMKEVEDEDEDLFHEVERSMHAFILILACMVPNRTILGSRIANKYRG